MTQILFSVYSDLFLIVQKSEFIIRLFRFISEIKQFSPPSLRSGCSSVAAYCRYESASACTSIWWISGLWAQRRAFLNQITAWRGPLMPGLLRTKGNKTCQTVKWSCPFKPCQTRSRSDKIAGSISACPFRLAATAPKDVERRLCAAHTKNHQVHNKGAKVRETTMLPLF